MKPIVDGFEKQYGRRLQVIRLDFLGQVGRAAARHYGIWMIPALALVDGTGDLLERQVVLVQPGAIHDHLERMRKPGTLAAGHESVEGGG